MTHAKFKTIQKCVIAFKNAFDLKGFAYAFKSLGFPNFLRFKMFRVSNRNFQEFTIIKFRFYEDLLKRQLFWTQENNPEFICKNKSQQVIVCFVIDLGVVLAKNHACFLINIGLRSMILEHLSHESSGFVGARLFQT